MSPALIVLAVLSAPQSKTLLEEKGMTYTGRNGYEDYLVGAEMLRDPDYSTYFTYCSAYSHRVYEEELPADTQGGLAKGIGPTSPKTPLAVRLFKMTPLAVKREMISKYGKALEWMEAGNRKSIEIAIPELNPSSLFPELSQFKKMAQLAGIKADVLIADGNSGSATSAWRDCLDFADRIGRGGTMIHTLVAIADRSIVLASINTHLQSLALQDYVRLEDQAKQVVKQEPLLLSAMKGERMHVNHLELNDIVPELQGSDLDNSEKKDWVAVRRMEGQTAKSFLREVRGVILARHEATEILLKQPESQWVGERRESDATLAERIASLATATFSQALSAEAKSRTQLRLLLLHCLIERYRHEWGELPTSLESFPAAVIRDPATNDVFQYAKRAGGYELASKGWGEVGRIHMRYVRPQSLGGGPESSPPPK